MILFVGQIVIAPDPTGTMRGTDSEMFAKQQERINWNLTRWPEGAEL